MVSAKGIGKQCRGPGMVLWKKQEASMAGVDEQGGGRAGGMSERSVGTGEHGVLGVYSKWEGDPLGEFSRDTCNPCPSSC